MNITLPTMSNVSLTTRSEQQRNKITAGASSVGFDKVLTSATEKEAQAISEKYGLTVGIESIPKNEKEIVRRGRSGSLQDVVIAPGILEKMKTDTALREKVYGYINYYTNEDQSAFMQMEQMYGVNVVGRSLIIHEDGTYTIWSAGETSPEEVEKGKKIEAEKQKERAEQERKASEDAEEYTFVRPLHLTELLPAQTLSALSSDSRGVMSTQDWIQQNLLLKTNKLNRFY
ncbi:DUF6033 family protein [Paenibacillus kribbensis]|uniref:DUF6033 family protein n=1 Tax=Paenibacillus kribbensis TaxID=172713 RepID=UPI0008381461|nr:DUF6033 family protein [Paenibacillus kribbensis]